MQYTTNFNLNLPDGTDKVLVSILNENMDKVDAILTDIYSKLPTPPQPAVTEWTIDTEEGTVGDDGMTYGVLDNPMGLEVGQSYKIDATMGNGTSVTIYRPVEGITIDHENYLSIDCEIEGTHFCTIVDGGTVYYDSESGTHKVIAEEGVTSYVFRLDGQFLPATLEIVRTLPVEVAESDLTEIEAEGDYLAFYNGEPKLCLDANQSYKLDIVVSNNTYSATAEANYSEGVVSANFIFDSLPQELGSAIGSISITDGVKADIETGDYVPGDYFLLFIAFNSGHRLSELSSIDKFVISSAEG